MNIDDQKEQILRAERFYLFEPNENPEPSTHYKTFFELLQESKEKMHRCKTCCKFKHIREFMDLIQESDYFEIEKDLGSIFPEIVYEFGSGLMDFLDDIIMDNFKEDTYDER